MTGSDYNEYERGKYAGVITPPPMKTRELRVTTSLATDDLTPASGKRIVVHGIWACCTIEGNLTSSLRATIAFGTGHTTDQTKILSSHRCGKGDVAHCVTMSPIYVMGNINEVVRLTNMTFTLGDAVYRAIIYYTEM